MNYGDLTKINPQDLPDFDVMIAGFPCQTFSVIGQRKGFEDERGQIIYSLIEILSAKNVSYFILENVKGLINHDKGKTLKTILFALNDAGYKVEYKVLNSNRYGVPQMRERIYFIGIRKDKLNKKVFRWATPKNLPNIRDYLCDDNSPILNKNDKTFIKYLNNKYNQGKFNLEELLKQDYLVLDTRQSDLRIYKEMVPTLRTGRHGILYVKKGELHKLTGYESLLLQGFDRDYVNKIKDKISETHLLSQAGNAMTVSIIESLAKSLVNYIGDDNE